MLARTSAIAALILLGCGADPRPPAAPTKPPAKPPAPARARAPLPPGHLDRGEVDRVLAQGPPWLLARVQLEEELRDGRFVGWKVLSMPANWTGFDLKVGDVVTRVNGLPIERPDEAFTAWSSLAVASDLKVTYERDGAQRELVLHIDGEPTQKAGAPASRPPPRKPRARSTVVITEEETPLGDVTED